MARRVQYVSRTRAPRSFTLGVPVRTEAVQASCCGGVLEIDAPKATKARPPKLEIQLSKFENRAGPEPRVGFAYIPSHGREEDEHG